MNEIRFTGHAERKFRVLKRHGFTVTREDVVETLRTPGNVSRGEKGRWVASRIIDPDHVLRVIYEEKDDINVVVTFYPARRGRYEGEL